MASAVPPMAHSDSSLSLARSEASVAEHMPECGIALPPGAPLSQQRVLSLRPTQLAVGMQQVHAKMDKVRAKQAAGKLDKWLRARPIPVVLGPGREMYLIDHHHLARALVECGVETAYVGVAKDLSHLGAAAFWAEMAAMRCLWPHAPNGSEVDPSDMPRLLPKTVAELADDPYRSLAALVRKAGGYAKSSKPFAEFMWANFLRTRVLLDEARAPGDVVAFIGHGMSHATVGDAAHLPGHTPRATLGPEQLGLIAAAAAGPAASAGKAGAPAPATGGSPQPPAAAAAARAPASATG